MYIDVINIFLRQLQAEPLIHESLFPNPSLLKQASQFCDSFPALIPAFLL
jgi:hypothetical protein